MGLLSEYNITDELTINVLKDMGFGESYAMSLSVSDNKKYDNFFKAKFYSSNTFENTFNFKHREFYCTYRYFPELDILYISIESMPSNYLFNGCLTKRPPNKRFSYTVKNYSDLLIYLSKDWLATQVKELEFLKY